MDEASVRAFPILRRRPYRLKIGGRFALRPGVRDAAVPLAGLLSDQRYYFQNSSTTSGLSSKIQVSVTLPSLMWAMWV
jgi:hypothetical protein